MSIHLHPVPCRWRLAAAGACVLVGFFSGAAGVAFAQAQPAPPGPVARPLAVLTEPDVPAPSHAKVNELLRRAGLAHEVEVLPWPRAYWRAQNEPDTCLFSTTRTPEREPLFEWVAPLRSTKWVLVGEKDNPAVRDVRNLETARGLVIGSYRQDAVAQFLVAQGVPVELVDTNLQNIRKLTARRIDLWATSAGVLPEMLADPALKARLQVLAVVRDVTVFLACHPKTAAQTLTRLRQSWAGMEADGTVLQLDSRYSR